MKDFFQIEWDRALIDDCRQLVRLAVREDLDRGYDITTLAMAPEQAPSTASIVARAEGVLAGLPAVKLALAEMDVEFEWTAHSADGEGIHEGQTLVELAGSGRDLLTTERLLLNLLGRLCGVATLTRRYVNAVQGTDAQIYDTRKTTPGWRRLEKYAVRCGGGRNHRLGLYEAVLIKDNHLALARGLGVSSLAQAVEKARQFLTNTQAPETVIVEIEVDTLEQLDEVLSAQPDVVLLDNMTFDELREAVKRRNAVAPQTALEASGGIDLTTVRGVAETGVERISVGALTHSATCLDVALDWTS